MKRKGRDWNRNFTKVKKTLYNTNIIVAVTIIIL